MAKRKIEYKILEKAKKKIYDRRRHLKQKYDAVQPDSCPRYDIGAALWGINEAEVIIHNLCQKLK